MALQPLSTIIHSHWFWVYYINQNNSLTWIKAIWGFTDPSHSPFPVFRRSELVLVYPIIAILKAMCTMPLMLQPWWPRLFQLAQADVDAFFLNLKNQGSSREIQRRENTSIPSGNDWQFAVVSIVIEIVNFPMKHGDFPSFLYVYQRVNRRCAWKKSNPKKSNPLIGGFPLSRLNIGFQHVLQKDHLDQDKLDKAKLALSWYPLVN